MHYFIALVGNRIGIFFSITNISTFLSCIALTDRKDFTVMSHFLLGRFLIFTCHKKKKNNRTTHHGLRWNVNLSFHLLLLVCNRAWKMEHLVWKPFFPLTVRSFTPAKVSTRNWKSSLPVTARFLFRSVSATVFPLDLRRHQQQDDTTDIPTAAVCVCVRSVLHMQATPHFLKAKKAHSDCARHYSDVAAKFPYFRLSTMIYGYYVWKFITLLPRAIVGCPAPCRPSRSSISCTSFEASGCVCVTSSRCDTATFPCVLPCHRCPTCYHHLPGDGLTF